jgi:hypothetical protein
VNDALLAIALIGVLAGGAIVLIDSLIITRVRRLAPRQADEDTRGRQR